MSKELFIVGESEATEAEYGFRSDSPVTILSMYDNEIYCTEGYSSFEAAKASLKADQVPSNQIMYL